MVTTGNTSMNKMITNMIFCVLRWTWSFVFIFVFVFVLVCIYVMCFCAATDFSVNKDLYIRCCRLCSLRRHHPPPPMYESSSWTSREV